MEKTDQETALCTLCPRMCRANRVENETGICGQTRELMVARAALHMWEEPCISGERGSGAVFFSGCALRCVFCQNHEIADGQRGKKITIERLSEIFLELEAQGANNINLVTAAHFVPQVIRALDLARQQGLTLPVVYNTSGYENVETLRMLEGYVDVYLPDFKYVGRNLSARYSHAPDYFERVSLALEEMVRQTGTARFHAEEEIRSGCWRKKEGFSAQMYQEKDGYQKKGMPLIMTRGVIVRHLLLLGCGEDSKKVIRYLLSTYRDRIFLSIMNQYTPLPHVKAYPELDRRIGRGEYERIIAYALELGWENGFIQEGKTAEESFIPPFDETGV